MNLPSLLETRVNIAGREIPVIVVGAGAGIVLALAVKLRGGGKSSATTATTTGADVNYNIHAAIQTSQAQQSAALQSAVSTLTGQIQNVQGGIGSSLASLRAQYLADLTSQIGQVQSQTQAGLAGLQQQFSGNLAQVQNDVQALRASTASQLAAQTAQMTQAQGVTGQQIQALASRVTTVEQGQAKQQTGLYNLTTWLGRWNLQLMNQLPPQQQQEAGVELTTNIMVPLQATSGNYRGY